MLLEKNEKVEVVNIDAKLIDFQKEKVLENAFKIKEFILNCSVKSPSAKKKAVDFEKFDDLFGRTWLEKIVYLNIHILKKCANETIEAYFIELKKRYNNIL